MTFLGLVTLAITCFTSAYGLQECRADRDCGRFEICNCAWDNQRRECKNIGFCLECREDRNCRSGERCSSSGVCVKDQACKWNSDCPAPERGSSAAGSCKNGRCEECDFSSDCPGSRRCESGKCNECSFSSDCPGRRSCQFDKCIECGWNSDCNGSLRCEFDKCV